MIASQELPRPIQVVIGQMDQFLAEKSGLVDRVLADGSSTRDLDIIFDRTGSYTGGHSTLFLKWGVYYDDPYAFILTHDKSPIALTSFNIWNGSLQIRQIQGVKGATILYGLGRWEHALVRVVEEFAYSTSKNEVHIQPAARNLWVENYLKRLKLNAGIPPKGLSPEKAKRRYDDVALGLGYEYDGNREVYCKRWPFRSAVC